MDLLGEAVTGCVVLLVSDRIRLAGSSVAVSSSNGRFVVDASAGTFWSFTFRASDKYAFMISVQSALSGNVLQAAKKLELSARKPNAEADCAGRASSSASVFVLVCVLVVLLLGNVG